MPRGECTLCHAPLARKGIAKHLAEKHDWRNHVGQVILDGEAETYFRPHFQPKPKNVRITAAEHAIVRRLIGVHARAHKVEKSGELDDWAFVYGFFVGAGVTPKRAHEFTLLVCYEEWEKDPIFASALPEVRRPA